MPFNLRTSFATRWRTSATIPRRSVRYPRHANSWLEESLCETASLFTLRAMSRSWSIAPPYPAWKNYAPMAQPLCGAAPRATGAPPPARNAIPDLVQAERARPPSKPGRTRPKHRYCDPAFASVRGRPTRMGGIGIPQSRIPPRRCVASPASGGVAIPVPAGPPSLPRQACGSSSESSSSRSAKGACEQAICWQTA